MSDSLTSPAKAAEPFDFDRAYRLIKQALELVNSFYPAGAREWLDVHREDVVKLLTISAFTLDIMALEKLGDQELSWLSENAPRTFEVLKEQGRTRAFAHALDVYTERHRKAFDIFKQRPPVIEQTNLFQAVV